MSVGVAQKLAHADAYLERARAQMPAEGPADRATIVELMVVVGYLIDAIRALHEEASDTIYPAMTVGPGWQPIGPPPNLTHQPLGPDGQGIAG